MTRFSPAEPHGDILVTVIVPVFNTAPELVERAVVSALDQTHSYLELLIVDDGSTEDIGEFLDRFAERDSRIRVVHQPNGGVSAARNTGVEYALGDFIAYLDADDYLEAEFLAAALAAAQTTAADVVFGGIRVLHRGGAVEWRTGGPSAKEPLVGTPDTIVSACVRALSDSPSPLHPTLLLSVTNVVSCLYRADIARRHPFIEGVSHAEDRLHNVHVLLGAASVVFCSDVWYAYDATHDQGATRRATTRTVTALARTVREFAGVGGAIGPQSELPDDAHGRIAQAAADGVLNYLKILSGVMAAVGRRRTNRMQLRQLLSEPSVIAATARATQTGWQGQIFASAARHGQIDLLLLLGWLWARTRGGFQMSVERTSRSPRERKARQ
ncbi:glycosyltransferase family 2 protein [Arthrobacter sp. 2RAF6]|uniref:glycosyltransferase family 2 protein n=1 Tax=Arthrobacter sp. 2RAF6 TaxID=3233002 RepID=UPI003F90D4E9